MILKLHVGISVTIIINLIKKTKIGLLSYWFSTLAKRALYCTISSLIVGLGFPVGCEAIAKAVSDDRLPGTEDRSIAPSREPLQWPEVWAGTITVLCANLKKDKKR